MNVPARADAAAVAADARWFPVDLDARAGRWSFLHLDVDVLERSTFLDDRIATDVSQGLGLDDAVFDAAPMGLSTRDAPAWLFHTSFCGSTLLARALHVPPAQVALKEPLILRRLADADHAGVAIDAVLPRAVALLSRKWAPGAGVLIKPTHVALGVAGRLMAASPGSRALMLTSSLEDFLVSNLKKPRETQAKLPQLAERAVHGTELLARLPPEAFSPPDVLGAAVLQWAGQRSRIAALARTVGRDRLRILELDQWIDDVEHTAVECSRWLGLPATAEALGPRVAEVARVNAKAIHHAYGASQRAVEARQIQMAYRRPLAETRSWAERHVLPALGSVIQADR